MGKIRVYELARELKLESKILLVRMQQLGITVPSHQSTLTAAQIDKIRASYSEAKPPKVIVRRRKKADAKDEGDEGQEHGESEVIAESEQEATDEGFAAAVMIEETPEAPPPQEESSDIQAAEATQDTATEENEEVVPPLVAAHTIEAVEEPTEAPSEAVAKSAMAKDNREPGGEAPQPKIEISRLRKRSEGATIIRKATPEEFAAAKAHNTLKQQQQRPMIRREEFPRPGGVGPRPPLGPRPPVNTTTVTSPDLVPTGLEETGRNKWGGRTSERGKNETADEFEERRLKSAAPKRRFRPQELLGIIDSDELDPIIVVDPSRKRTVYTPSRPQRKRDIKRRKDLKVTQITTPRAAYRVVRMESATITVGELAKQLSVKASELIKKLMGQGIMATINQTVDFETATLIASEYSYECKQVFRTITDILKKDEIAEGDVQMTSRPSIVTVMGHVDHGKTSILDAIRKSDTAAGEAGGITQHIGAYTVHHNDAEITFLDTPGHEAFSAMRSRGAKVTDIVVLVVAADDGVMPQTLEAIAHARSAGVPIIVAVNKIDKPNINLDRIYKELAAHGVQSEDWGGENQFVKVSAIKNEGIDELLEAIQLQSEILELRVPINVRATGTVVESHLDKGRGPVATIIVNKGILRVGDYVVAGGVTGRIRAMNNQNGVSIKEATPSTPAEIIGLPEVPMAGDEVRFVDDEKMGREVASLREQAPAMQRSSAALNLEDLLNKVNSAEIPQVPLIIKADTQGSVEAIAQTLLKLNTAKVGATLVLKGVGGINESDINLAETSKSVILGFNVRAMRGLGELAEKRGVVIKYYNIIYELVDDVKALMAGKLPPICTEVFQGRAEVRDTISVPKIGLIAGSSVLDGKITRTSRLRLIRDAIVIFDGKVASLRRFKDDVREVQHGYECGISIEGFDDIKVGDVIEAYRIEETAASLDS